MGSQLAYSKMEGLGTEPVVSALELVAEISIGLIGFAGVVATFARSRMPPAVRSFRVTALMLNGATALIGSLLPIVLLNYGITPSATWVAAGGVVIAWQAAVLAWAAATLRELFRNGQIPRKVTLVVLSLASMVLLYLVYGTLFDHVALPAIYLAVLAFSLMLGLFHFLMLVVSIQSVDE
jgi:hypothetical protein